MPEPTTTTGPELVDVVVVGAGLGGLIAAATAAPPGSGRRVLVLDPHPPGGRARCDARDGYTFNRGPRALYVGGPAEAALRDLGVDVDAGAAPTMLEPLLISDGRAHRFPDGPAGLLRTTALGHRDKVSAAAMLARIGRADEETGAGLTLGAWLDQRRPTPAARRLVEALVRLSTYANAPDQVAASVVLPAVRRAITGGVRYLDGGWQRLVEELLVVTASRAVELRVDRVLSVRADGGGVTVTSERGIVRATTVVLASGTPEAAAGLLGGEPSSWPRLGPPALAACLELGVARPPRHRFALGLDRPTYASTHCPPARLAPPGRAVVHLLRYRSPLEALDHERDEAELRGLLPHLGIEPEQVEAERFLATMTVTGALPVPAADGRPVRPPVAVTEHPGVHLVGDWVGPDHLLLDAVAATARRAGRAALDRSATMEAR